MKQKHKVLQRSNYRSQWYLRFAGFVLAVLCLSVFSPGLSAAEGAIPKEKLLSQIIHSGLERWHYNAKQLDDTFSQKALDEFLSYLDFSKRFFLESDIRELEQYKNQLDDHLAVGSTMIMEKTTQRLRQRMKQVIGFYKEYLEKPFDFTKPETLELDPDKRPYCTSIDELREYWRKTLKYRTLLHYITLKETKKGKKGTKNAVIKVDPALEAKARKAVAKNFKSIFNRMVQGLEKDSFSRYMNAMVRVCDPHTVYFPPVDKVTFDMQMYGRFEGIGATLTEEDGYVKVANIIPGGPSWRQKQLQTGDLIIKVAQGNKEAEDIIGMRVEDAVKLIRGKKGTLVRLTVKKTDGRIEEIPITRDEVVLEETFAKSAVIYHKKSGKRFGYIYLPGFYNDFERENGRNAADDVRKELEKLKKKKIDGVILDIRSNSGGALRDAVKMSGLFIPEGPMVQVKNKRSGVKALTDPDPGVVYEGPLVVMVNSMSASASEILAGALQDYNRAIIVGGKQSFGKGTVQAVVNLDRILDGKAKRNEHRLGALSITIQKFYRVNGKAIQIKGVTPDIVLPDHFDFMEIGERYMDYALSWDRVDAAEYQLFSPTPPAFGELVEKSKKRVDKSPFFVQARKYISKLEEIRQNTHQNLQLEALMKRQALMKNERKKLTDKSVKMAHLKITPSGKLEKKKSERLAKVEQEKQDRWFKDIHKDAAIGEVIEILNDVTDMRPHYSANKTAKNKVKHK